MQIQFTNKGKFFTPSVNGKLEGRTWYGYATITGHSTNLLQGRNIKVLFPGEEEKLVSPWATWFDNSNFIAWNPTPISKVVYIYDRIKIVTLDPNNRSHTSVM